MRYPNLPAKVLDAIKESTDPAAIQRWCVAFATASDQAAFEAAFVNGAAPDKLQT